VVHDGPALFIAQLCTGEAFGRGEILEVLAADMACIRVQVRHVELDVVPVAELVDGVGSCCVYHVLSVGRGTDIIGSIGGRVPF